MEKTCKQCQSQFTVVDQDLEFYKKISPTFADKTFEIPPPSLCPDCRRQKRLIWRNMKTVYSRKCDFSGDHIISPFPPNSKFKIYKNDIWWSDQWSGFDYGRDFDFNRPFFEQLRELQLEVPCMHSFISNNENSDYCNCTTGAKDSYLVQSATEVENCYYSQCISRDKDCIDCLRVYKSEKCYECVLVDNCFDGFYLTDSDRCAESYFLDNCRSCKNCFACANLAQKQYWVYNKESDKAGFEKARNDFLKLEGEEKDKKIKEIREYLRGFPKRYSHSHANENTTGDYVYHSKNIYDSYVIGFCENIRYSFNLEYSKDCMDHDFWGESSEKFFECGEVGNNSYNVVFCNGCWEATNLFYCLELVSGSKDCFGCVGLKGVQYCILNKQYSKDEYENLVTKIIEHMQKTGEWGEFFPMSMSYFAYNESAVNDYFPISRDEAKKIGAPWQDEDFGIKYDGPFYEPEDIKEYASNSQKVDEALKGILKCKATGKPFKLQAGEMSFYIKNNLQTPLYHPDFRYQERFKLLNPLRLWHRRCTCEESGHDHSGCCPNEFETTYAPERSEKVYCEKCYQQTVM